MHTELCELLGIHYPIISSGMHWVSRAELAAAVSNAGGLGTITAATHPGREALAAEIRRVRELTDRPFAVNISMLPGTLSPHTAGFFDTVVQEGVPIVETAGRSPEEFMPILKGAGIKVIHKVPAVRFARKAQAIGADAVLLVGQECGGQPGLDGVSTLELVPRAVDELSIPVIAGGGIADARGIAAALALGASGVAMGTRFLASRESVIHNNLKQWMCGARETDTVLVLCSAGAPMRVARNKAAEEVLQMERDGASPEALFAHAAERTGQERLLEEDVENGLFAMGQCVGLIHDIKPVRAIVQELVAGTGRILKQLGEKGGGIQ